MKFIYWIMGAALLLVTVIVTSNHNENYNLSENNTEIVQKNEIQNAKPKISEAMMKKINAKNREFERAYFINDKNLPEINFQFLTPDGTLSKQAIKAIGLTDEQARLFQEKYDYIMTCIQENAKRNIVVDKRNTNPSEGVYAFKIPGDPDASEVLISNSLAEIGKHFGSKELLYLKSGILKNNKLGFLGRRDVNIVVKDTVVNNVTNRTVYYTYSDPDTGMVNLKGQVNIEEFKMKFGDILEQ
jgi:hypothetical protein